MPRKTMNRLGIVVTKDSNAYNRFMELLVAAKERGDTIAVQQWKDLLKPTQ